MSDARLRELHRRALETGDALDEGAWLAARLRAGELERGRVELAAWLADPASLATVGSVALPAPGDDPGRFVFERGAQAACARYALACGRAALGVLERGCCDCTEPRLALGVVEQLLTGEAAPDVLERALFEAIGFHGEVFAYANPSPTNYTTEYASVLHVRAILADPELRARLEAHPHEVRLIGPPPERRDYGRYDPEKAAARAIVEALLSAAWPGVGMRLVQPERLPRPFALVERARRSAVVALAGDRTRRGYDFFERAELTQPTALSEALRADLVPWLLGCGDPLRMRVAKRAEVEILPEDNASG